MKKNASTTCPRCGWHDTFPIVNGQPRPDLKRVGVEKDLAMRDWLRGMDTKDRVCAKCGHQWATGPGG